MCGAIPDDSGVGIVEIIKAVEQVYASVDVGRPIALADQDDPARGKRIIHVADCKAVASDRFGAGRPGRERDRHLGAWRKRVIVTGWNRAAIDLRERQSEEHLSEPGIRKNGAAGGRMIRNGDAGRCAEPVAGFLITREVNGDEAGRGVNRRHTELNAIARDEITTVHSAGARARRLRNGFLSVELSA